jgi:hypothetical protein
VKWWKMFDLVCFVPTRKFRRNSQRHVGGGQKVDRAGGLLLLEAAPRKTQPSVTSESQELSQWFKVGESALAELSSRVCHLPVLLRARSPFPFSSLQL